MLDCESEDDQTIAQSATPRLSGPEEQWDNTDHLKWTNQQLNISLNKTSSSLNVPIGNMFNVIVTTLGISVQ